MENPTTRKFPRTTREAFGMSAQDAQAIFCYRRPLHERALMWLFRWGWALAILAAILLTGCADEAPTWAADQANLADAIAQAANEVGQ